MADENFDPTAFLYELVAKDRANVERLKAEGNEILNYYGLPRPIYFPTTPFMGEF